MSDKPFHLTVEQAGILLQRYRSKSVAALSYGTVQDFCDSRDHFQELSRLQGDLKDQQRPRALKLILALFEPGASLVEIGAGEPYVAQMLVELGYQVTVVDPYDGSGRGPTEFDFYRQKYPDVRFVRGNFNGEIELAQAPYDGIFFISVLEHVHQPFLENLYSGIKRYLKKGGYSIHLVDHVVEGEGAEFHLKQLAEIVALQSSLNTTGLADVILKFAALLQKAAHDVETFYLSPEGHDSWRSRTPYLAFPFRKVISVETCSKLA